MILIAEDQMVFLELYSLIFNKLGLPIILAINGQEAIDKALKNDPALILMDIQMPLMNGYDAAEELRKHGYNKPIIAVTADDKLDEDLGKKAGINDYLFKPIKPADVERLVKKWMNVDGGIQHVSEEESSAAQNEVFCSVSMFDTFMNNEEMATSLLSRFIERTGGQLEKLSGTEKTGEWESSWQIVHMIRGAAFTMSGLELGKAASVLEMAYKNQDRKEIEKALPQIHKAFERFKTEAEMFINTRKKNAI